MKRFFATLPLNCIDCFKPRWILCHLAGIVLTFVLVTSGLDWRYFFATHDPVLLSWMFPAVRIGGALPILLPFLLLALGSGSEDARIGLAGWAVGQAEILGSLISSAYKAVTGRAHPTHASGVDLSHEFRFGFLRGGVFWGWPSSHTTIAFAAALTLFTLFPKQKWLRLLVLAYALYIGLGVSMTIHWLSDFLAGAIIGSVIGIVVGQSFLPGQESAKRLS